MISPTDEPFELPPVLSVHTLPPDAAATEQLGEAIGGQLDAGAVLALVGDMGTGKTTLVRGLAKGLDLDDPAGVASPTYLLVVEHPGPVVLRHADAYLPAKLEGFLADGGLDYLFDDTVVVAVEWADRIGRMLPETALWLEFTVINDGGRRIRLRSHDSCRFPWIGSLRHNSGEA